MCYKVKGIEIVLFSEFPSILFIRNVYRYWTIADKNVFSLFWVESISKYISKCNLGFFQNVSCRYSICQRLYWCFQGWRLQIALHISKIHFYLFFHTTYSRKRWVNQTPTVIFSTIQAALKAILVNLGMSQQPLIMKRFVHFGKKGVAPNPIVCFGKFSLLHILINAWKNHYIYIDRELRIFQQVVFPASRQSFYLLFNFIMN